MPIGERQRRPVDKFSHHSMSDHFMTSITVSELICPSCGAEEVTTKTPDGSEKLLIRGFKAGTSDGRWWSECLVCSGYYGPIHAALGGLEGGLEEIKEFIPHPDAMENYKKSKGEFYLPGVKMLWFCGDTISRE